MLISRRAQFAQQCGENDSFSLFLAADGEEKQLFLKLFLEGTFFILTNRKAGEIININILQFVNLKFSFAVRILTRHTQTKSDGFIFPFFFREYCIIIIFSTLDKLYSV